MLLDGVYRKINRRPNKFLLMEGMNGAGKTAKTKLLAEDLAQTRLVFATVEPTRWSFGAIIRTIIDGFLPSRRLLSKAKEELEEFWKGERHGFCSEIYLILDFLKRGRGQLSEAERQKLFVVDRLFHLKKTIDIELLQGATVVQDRYDISSYVHGMANGFFFERNLACHQAALGSDYLAPDTVFYFWIPAELAVERLKQSGKVIDIYESKETLRRVEMASRQLLGFEDELPKPGKYLEREFSVLGEHHPIFVINAEPSKKEVYETVRKLID